MRNRSLPFFCLSLMAFCFTTFAQAANLKFMIHPIINSERIPKYYKPLTDYLTEKTGKTIEIVTATNYQSHWHMLRKGAHPDLFMDASHLSDWMVQKRQYEPLAKVLDVVSFTLVTAEDDLIFEPNELVGRKVATLHSPSMGALLLNELFPNTLRRPVIVSVDDSAAAVKLVQEKKARAAIIPSPMVGTFLGLNTVVVTRQFPHVTISSRHDLDSATKAAIKKALLEAGNSPQGQRMLQAINVPGYEAVSASSIAGRSDILQNVYGN